MFRKIYRTAERLQTELLLAHYNFFTDDKCLAYMHFPNAFKWEQSLFCLSFSLPLMVTSSNLTRSFGISLLICFKIRNKVAICPSVASSVTRIFDKQSFEFCNEQIGLQKEVFASFSIQCPDIVSQIKTHVLSRQWQIKIFPHTPKPCVKTVFSLW